MTTYNTGNALGSSDARDLYDNAEVFDEVINGTSETVNNRFGDPVRTLAGYETLATGIPAVEASMAAQEAQAGAEAARDAAQVAATLYPDEATGRAAVADSEYFRVVGSGNVACHIYRRINSGSSTLIVSLSSDTAVRRPPWSGQKSGWPDPFFRLFDLTSQAFLGRDRWYWNTVGSEFQGWEMVANSVFAGRALRRTVSGNVPLSGPAIWLDELGAAAGDTITVYALVTGNGCVFGGYGRFANSSEGHLGDQFVMVSAAGSSTPTLGATPTLMRVTAAAPAGATRVHFYPITNTPGGTFEIVALWAHKGGAGAGPEWPVFSDGGDYLDMRVAENAATAAAAKGKADYAVIAKTAVSASAESVTIAGSGYSTNPRDLVFMGWGETYTPAGVSFNALRIKSLSRTVGTAARWARLRIVVRTGATPAASGATVVAVGSASVFEHEDTLTDVTILLRHPVSGNVITLTDASFSGGSYFIGVYAETATGAPAACGEPRGTLPNSAGQAFCYMSTGGNPLAGAWTATAAGSNVRQAFQHLLLTAPVEGLAYSPSPAASAAVLAGAGLPVPEIIAPPFVFGVQGRECNVYLDNLFVADAADYFVDVDSSALVGSQQAERYTWVPSAALASGTLTVRAHDKRSGALLASHVMQQRAAASSAGSGSTKKLLVIGDSLINAGVITQTLLDVAGADVMGVSLIGTRGTAPNRHEGRGGWSINDYSTAGRTYYSFTVSGIVTQPAINSTTYTNNGNTYTVQELSLSGGSGTIVCSVSPLNGAPTASGTLTKASGSGDATITFSSSAAVPGNPFWIGGALNFAQYLTDRGFDTPDWVVIGLGINDVFGQTTDAGAAAVADAAFAILDNLINSIKAANAGIKVALMIPSPPAASQDAFGANYATGQTRWRNKRNVLIWSRQMIAKYAGQEAARVYLLPSNVALDTVNNYDRAASAPVNSRATSVMVARQNNGVHPGVTGYQQIADAMWAFLKFHA